MKHFDLEVARAALERWDGKPTALAHIATSGNAVYRFHDGAHDRILRLTDTGFRAARANEAEMAFLEHLMSCGVRANVPVRSRSGRAVEVLGDCSASVLTWAPGARVDPGTPLWDRPMLEEWGRTLGGIHRAATSYPGPPRWDWRDEGLIADAKQLIPESDGPAHAELARVLAHLEGVPRRRETFGMTHADFGAQNFHFDPALGITAFDFGNCCEHWFATDLVISLSTFRRLAERERFRDWVLAGYRDAFALDEAIWSERGWFMRLRILYVYLSRLKWFGPAPDAEQRATLAMLSGLVAEHGGSAEHGPLASWF